MKNRTLTVQFMIDNFMDLHNSGKSIPEIAETCNVSIWSVYGNLQEIAIVNHVTRESLLERVHKKHELINGKALPTRIPEVNVTDLLENFETINQSINNILDTISTVLEREE